MAAQWQQDTQDSFAESGTKVRWLTECNYVAKSWNHTRRVTAKIEYMEKGGNPRYVVANLAGKPQFL